ncbi:MAG: prepilin-type N-terminal cleavage/methylation domain-containing protein [Candidatus Moraniibacteriota bacterium]
MDKKNKNKYSGFSLIEMLISVFIFTLIVTVVTFAFSKAFFSSQKTRVVQRNIEDGRIAIETMAKNIRMSKKLVATESTIKMYNNSQDKCIAYVFLNNKLQIVMYDAEGSTSDPTCADPTMSNAVDLVSANITGSFHVDETSTASPKRIGRATILVNIGTGTDMQHIQTTVSFRDYAGG